MTNNVKRPIEDYAADAVKVLREARKVLGNSTAVNLWLNSPQAALGGRVPAVLLSSAKGATLVMQELTRLKANHSS